jgi:hypothetical protein
MIWVVAILLVVVVVQLGTIITLMNQSKPVQQLDDPHLMAMDRVIRLSESIDYHLSEIDRRLFELSTKLPR